MKSFSLIYLFVFCTTLACAQSSGTASQNAEATTVEIPDSIDKIKKSPEEWKEELGEKAYEVLREKDTERAFTGEHWDTKTNGIYVCAGCALPLFSSETKFESGTGWPSFWKPLADRVVETRKDGSYGMTRQEVTCARCEGHLGHIFEDGPKPTGLRYCVNSAALKFMPHASAKLESQK